MKRPPTQPPHDVPRLLEQVRAMLERGPSSGNPEDFAELRMMVEMFDEVERELRKPHPSRKRIQELMNDTWVRVADSLGGAAPAGDGIKR